MGTMRKWKVSLFDVVDDSSALAKKANGSLNGGNNMTPSINKWYEKPSHRDSMNFGAEVDSSGMASKRGVLKLMISNHWRRRLHHRLLSPAYMSFFGGSGNNYVGVQIGGQEYVYVGDYLLLLIWQQVSSLLDLKISFVFSWLLIF